MDKEHLPDTDFTKKINRREVLGKSAITLGAIYLAPATSALLTAQRATAQSGATAQGDNVEVGAARPCCEYGRLDFTDRPTASGWTVSYTNTQCQVVNGEAVPTRGSGDAAQPVGWDVCCDTDLTLISPGGVSTPYTDNCHSRSGSDPISGPWCCDVGRIDFTDRPIATGWTVSYTNTQCQVIYDEAIPTRNANAPVEPIGWDVCCDTALTLSGPDNVDVTFHDDCLSRSIADPIIPPWCCCK